MSAREEEEEESQPERQPPLITLTIRWAPRGKKLGHFRSEDRDGVLLDSDWSGKLLVAPLEVRYHHRFVLKLVGFFLDPWEQYSDMDMPSLIEVRRLMRSARCEQLGTPSYGR